MPAKTGPGPSVKDQELYEKLRTEGNSKEKSARIANSAAATSRRKVSRSGGGSPVYADWTKSDLRSKAKQVGIKSRSGMSKKQLIKALRSH